MLIPLPKFIFQNQVASQRVHPELGCLCLMVGLPFQHEREGIEVAQLIYGLTFKIEAIHYAV